MPNRVVSEQYTGFSALSVGTTNVAPFAGTAFGRATVALLSFEASAVRYRLDGTAATSGSGHFAPTGQTIALEGSDVIRGLNLICPTETGIVMASWGFL